MQQQQQQSSRTELLDWTTRIKIALGAARGLLYIHDRAPLQVHKQISLLQAVKTNLLPPPSNKTLCSQHFVCKQSPLPSPTKLCTNAHLCKTILLLDSPVQLICASICTKPPKDFISISDSSLAHSQSISHPEDHQLASSFSLTVVELSSVLYVSLCRLCTEISKHRAFFWTKTSKQSLQAMVWE
jgi:hypothetical protein